MRIATLALQELRIPFKVRFAHASAQRAATESVLVLAAAEGELRGYGEGCPRRYVTGESVASARAFLDRHRASLVELSDLEELRSWASARRAAIDDNPAAWCGVELALLDLLAKSRGTSTEALLGCPALAESYRYTAVLGINDDRAFVQQLRAYIGLGFTDFKLKISGDHGADSRRLHELYDCVPGARTRLDGNNIWRTGAQAIDYLQRLPAGFCAVEEPVTAGDFETLDDVAKALGIPVILDESVARVDELAHLARHPEQWMVNVRISKLGGVLRSCAVAEGAAARGISIVIGAHVGETSILTRAALTVAETFRDNVFALEGAAGTHLLSADVAEPSLTFGAGAAISTRALTPAAGFGLRHCAAVADTYAVDSDTVR